MTNSCILSHVRTRNTGANGFNRFVISGGMISLFGFLWQEAVTYQPPRF
jgi:hypothetical protein